MADGRASQIAPVSTLRRHPGVIPSARTARPYNPQRLTLTPGTRLGPYEVTALIGVGGMGEVYRATDTKLKRDVAVPLESTL